MLEADQAAICLDPIGDSERTGTMELVLDCLQSDFGTRRAIMPTFDAAA